MTKCWDIKWNVKTSNIDCQNGKDSEKRSDHK